VAERFGVNGFPTIYLVKGTDMFKFSGDRSVDGFVKFANEGYKKADKSSVPFPSLLEEVLGIMPEEFAEEVRHHYLFKKNVSLFLMGIGALLGLIFGMILGCSCAGGSKGKVKTA